jgi:hypothetical protein
MFSLKLKRILCALVFLALTCSGYSLTKDDFVTIQNGHLHKDGRRLKVWGTNVLFVGDKRHEEMYATSYESIDTAVERLKESGYNGIRFWARGWGKDMDYEKGDKSQVDYHDYFISKLKQNGFVIWIAGMNDHALGRQIAAEDVNVIDEPQTADKWIEAVSGEKILNNKSLMMAWDKRLRQLYLNNIKKYLDHYNQYTGMHSYEDPVFGTWELSNEEWWISSMLAGNWKTCPKFFREELIRKWNSWLKDKYTTTQNLKQSWTSILEGESLEEQNIVFAPMAVNTVDVQVATLGAGNLKQLAKVHLSQENMPQKRGKDVVEFITNMFITYKKEVEAKVRAMGDGELGCSIVPIIWDTGMRNDLPTAYAFSESDAACAGCYIRMFTAERQNPRFPWKSGLLESPRMYWDSPWLEHNKIKDKPFYVYESNTWNPNKYRAEWPYRLASLAAIQDWDWVNIYQIDGFRKIDEYDEPYTHPMSYETDSHHWSGCYYIFDEVFQAAIKSAGEMFLSGGLEPARNPTVISFGKDAVFNMDAQNYRWRPQGLNLWPIDMMPATVYRYGLRLEFDMNQDKPVKVDGPYVLNRAFQYFVIKPTDQITYDWQKGYLEFDTNKGKSIVGFLPKNWSFGNDVTFSDITINHPQGQSYVIEGERYAALSFVAKDGKNLESSKNLTLTAVSTSFNEGFKVNEKLIPQRTTDKPYAGLLWGEKYSKLFEQKGSKVLVSRVGAVIESPVLKNKNYVEYDFNLNRIGQGKCKHGRYILNAQKPIFFVEFIQR